MDYIMFARWFGIISVLLSVGILFNLTDARRMAKNMMETESGFIMGGVLPIIFGSYTFIHQNSFTIGWQLVVTLIGLFMLIIGSFRVIFVKKWKQVIHRNLDKIPALFSLFGLMLGLLLLYVGFFSSMVSYHAIF